MTLPSALTTLAYTLHIGGGTVGFASGIVAICARKGDHLHRRAGTVFFAAMLVMATAALYLAAVIPGQTVNLFIGTFALYLILTSWLTVRRREGAIGFAERAAMVVAFCLWAPFALLSFQLAAGMTPFFHSAVPLKGPVLIAIFVFTALLTIAAVFDAKVVWTGGITGAPRVARHLWRMCLAFTMAAGSFFTNALPKVFPGIYKLPLLVLFAPQFLLLGVLVFWMIRVRLTSWYAQDAAAQI